MLTHDDVGSPPVPSYDPRLSPGVAAGLDPATRVAVRLRIPSWRDPRLLGGILIVLLAAGLGTVAVGRAAHTIPVFAAATTLAPGTVITRNHLTVVQVQIGSADDLYLGANEPLASSRVLSRTVVAGELIPRSAVVPAGEWSQRAVTVLLPSAVVDAIGPGQAVELWSSARTEGAGPRYGPPRRLVPRAWVIRLAERGRSLAVTPTRAVDLQVPAANVPAVLDAVANEASLTIIPLPDGTTPEVSTGGAGP